MCAALLQQYYSVEWSGNRCSLSKYYWIGCPSGTPGLCLNVCSPTVSFVLFLLCLADAIPNAWCVFHQYCQINRSKWFWQVAPRAQINFSSMCFILSQLHTLSSKLFINTCAILHIYLFMCVTSDIEICCWILKIYYVHTSECQLQQVEEDREVTNEHEQWSGQYKKAPVYSQPIMPKFYHRNKCWQKNRTKTCLQVINLLIIALQALFALLWTRRKLELRLRLLV